MAQEFTEQVHIDGSDDEVQLRVLGHTTQTEPLQTWENSVEEILAQITDEGLLQVGDIPPLATPASLLQVHRDKLSLEKPTRGLQVSGEVEDEQGDNVYWSVHDLTVSGDATTVAHAASLRVSLNAVDAPLETAVGVEIGLSKEGIEAIDQAIGLDISDVDQADENYAIYTRAGIVHVGDTFEVPVMLAAPNENALADFVKLYIREVNGQPVLFTKDETGVERIAAGEPEEQVANTFYSGPPSGAAAQPTFRSLVASDLPSHDHDAAVISSGVLDNARVNWDSPGAVGSSTANSGSFTTLNVNAGTSQVGLTVKTNATTGNVVEWKNSSDVVLGSVTTVGLSNINHQSPSASQAQTALKIFTTAAGAPQTGFGNQIQFSAKANGSADLTMGLISSYWVKPTAPRKGGMIITTLSEGIGFYPTYVWLDSETTQIGGVWDGSSSTAVYLNGGANTTSTQTTVKNVVNINATGTQASAIGGNGFGVGLLFSADSSTNTWQAQGRIYTAWDDATHANRRSKMNLTVFNTTTEVVGLTIGSDSSSNPKLGFFGAASVTKPAVTGSKGGNAALASLITALADLGLITDSTT